MSHEPEAAISLSRDITAIQIPSGNIVAMPAGTEVVITQTLGGSITVMPVAGGICRIRGEDADALGLTDFHSAQNSAPAGDGPATEEQVWEQLRTCFDPEIPVNIVDLGLIYDLRISPLAHGKSRVDVAMTLTAAGCGMGPAIAADAESKILTLNGVEVAAVRVVWDPPWSPEKISETGKKALGII